MGDGLHDGAGPLDGVRRLEDARAHEHTVHAQLKHTQRQRKEQETSVAAYGAADEGRKESKQNPCPIVTLLNCWATRPISMTHRHKHHSVYNKTQFQEIPTHVPQKATNAPAS